MSEDPSSGVIAVVLFVLGAGGFGAIARLIWKYTQGVTEAVLAENIRLRALLDAKDQEIDRLHHELYSRGVPRE
jgi:predicted HTH domain antitoxin